MGGPRWSKRLISCAAVNIEIDPDPWSSALLMMDARRRGRTSRGILSGASCPLFYLRRVPIPRSISFNARECRCHIVEREEATFVRYVAKVEVREEPEPGEHFR